MNEQTGPLTLEDLDRGWKEIEVEDRTGLKSTIRLSIPGWRKARVISLTFQETQDSWDLIRPCLPPEMQNEQWLDRLTPQSLGQLHTIAVAILCGNSALKMNPDPVAPPAPC